MTNAIDWGTRPILEFDNDDPMFVRGVEVGLIWEALRARPEMLKDQQVHKTNETMMRRVADSCGYSVIIEQAPAHADWIRVSFFRMTQEALA